MFDDLHPSHAPAKAAADFANAADHLRAAEKLVASACGQMRALYGRSLDAKLVADIGRLADALTGMADDILALEASETAERLRLARAH